MNTYVFFLRVSETVKPVVVIEAVDYVSALSRMHKSLLSKYTSHSIQAYIMLPGGRNLYPFNHF